MIDGVGNTTGKHVVVIGAGLAGLACARAVVEAGARVTVLESNDRPGGRVWTDEVDGFLIDHGFQVILDSYDEVHRHVDMNALGLYRFEPGALVRRGGSFLRLADPLRKPASAPKMLGGGLVRPRDLIAVVRLLRQARSAASEPPEDGDTTILTALEVAGVSESMLESFWRPFLAGITLDPHLQTSSRFLEFLLEHFSRGVATVPGDGMRRLPQMMLGALPIGTVRLGAKVTAVEKGRVKIKGQGWLDADAVVVATDGRRAAKLVAGLEAPEWSRVGQIAFDTGSRAPHSEPILVLDGENSGPVNNLQVMSAVAPGYAPTGSSLVTCSILEPDLHDDDEKLDLQVRTQLGQWYGPQVNAWRTLRVDRIKRALPTQPVGSLNPLERDLRLKPWLWVAGDHQATASIEGALSTGRHAGEQAVAALTQTS
ncbi:MAG: FAD-dependent oxidoreductase [Actinobacteria bacterium]|uniref:Unannotated protein n=1 Tax=freshwater metagenome TaxID=449393 RepID=A0A6J7D5T3_9ZZZZ|nr:FAD-dependent oxidoreductase [Actinomycetota bacterium]